MSKLFVTVFTILNLLSTTSWGQIDTMGYEDSDRISIVKIKLGLTDEQSNKINEINKINDLYIDNNNRVLVATDQGLIITGTNQKESYLYSNIAFNNITADKKLNIYSTGKGKLYLISKEKEVNIPGTDVETRDLIYQNGKLWLATNQGLYTYTINSGNWNQYTRHNSKLKTNSLNNIKIDDQDIMWIGTENGYVRIKDNHWSVKDKRENIIATQNNSEGQWMVSHDEMWLIDKYNRKYPVGLSPDFYSGKMNDFVIDSKGRVYMASNILVRFNPYEDKVERFGSDVGLLSKKCIALACDKNNNIWIGTADAGLFTIVFDDIAREQLSITPLLEQAINCAGEDNAIIKLSVSGGKKPYRYKWSDKSLNGKNPNGIKPGEYAVTVTDKSGGQIITNIVVTSPAPIVIETIENRRISDTDKSDGRVEISTSGGTGNLTTTWSTGENGNILNNVPAGLYTATITDENGCKVSQRYRVRKEKYIPELDIAKVSLGQKLRINELNFKADSTNIESENFEILDEVYEFLMANKSVTIEIGGHTNTIPPHSYCDLLSTKRAESVKEYIVERGIASNRIKFKGYGKREPLTESTSLSGRRKNQRVEVTILSL